MFYGFWMSWWLQCCCQENGSKGTCYNHYGCCVWTMSIVVLYQNSYINVLFWLKSTLYTHFMPWQSQYCCRSIMCCLILLCLFNILRSFRVCVHARVFVQAYESWRNYIHACNKFFLKVGPYNVSGKRTPLRRKLVTGLMVVQLSIPPGCSLLEYSMP